MGKNAIAFIAGLGTGMLQAKKDKDAKAERDEDRAMRKEEHAARMEPIEQERKKRKVLADANAPVTVEEGAGGMLRPETMDNRDVGLPENTSMANQGLNPQAYRVAGKSMATGAEAESAAAAANTPEAQNKRAVAGLRGLGDFQGASQIETTARQGKLADIQLTQAEKAMAHDQAFREITETFSRQGWSAVPKIYENYQDGNTAKVTEDGKGGAVVSIFNAKGEPIGQKAFASEMDFITGAVAKVDPKLWVSMKVQEKKDAQAQTNFDRKESREGRESDAKAGYYNSVAGKNDAAATKPVVDRMSEIDKTTLLNINKQRDTIQQAIVKGQADGTFDPASPGAKALSTQLAALTLKERQLHSKYSADEVVPDPLGLRKPAGGSKGKPAAASAAKDGQVDILQQEMRKATAALDQAGADPEARTRAEGDIASLTKELGRLGVKAGAPAPAKVAALPAAAGGIALPAPAPVVIDPAVIQAKLAVENAEMGAGKRMAYSPDVKLFLDQQRAAEQEASRAARAQEGQRAAAASRGLR